MMDTNKKILIGAISAAVVIGGVAIGLLLSQTPEQADLTTIPVNPGRPPPRRKRRPPLPRTRTLLPA